MMQAEMIVKKETFKHVESELFAYHETKAEINRIRQEILHGTASPDNNGGGRSNLPGDPTFRVVSSLDNHKRLKYLENIANAIEEVYTQLPEEKQKLIRMKYWTRPQLLTWDGIADRLNVVPRTAKRWRNEVVYAVAKSLGWR